MESTNSTPEQKKVVERAQKPKCSWSTWFLFINVAYAENGAWIDIKWLTRNICSSSDALSSPYVQTSFVQWKPWLTGITGGLPTAATVRLFLPDHMKPCLSLQSAKTYPIRLQRLIYWIVCTVNSLRVYYQNLLYWVGAHIFWIKCISISSRPDVYTLAAGGHLWKWDKCSMQLDMWRCHHWALHPSWASAKQPPQLVDAKERSFPLQTKHDINQTGNNR